MGDAQNIEPYFVCVFVCVHLCVMSGCCTWHVYLLPLLSKATIKLARRTSIDLVIPARQADVIASSLTALEIGCGRGARTLQISWLWAKWRTILSFPRLKLVHAAGLEPAQSESQSETSTLRLRLVVKLARRVRIELTQQDLESRSPALGHASALKINFIYCSYICKKLL